MCTLEGCTAEGCGLEQEFCNANSLKCATEHMACSGGAYADGISWDLLKTGIYGGIESMVALALVRWWTRVACSRLLNSLVRFLVEY